LQAYLIPGVEIWIIANTYESANFEIQYLKEFIKTLFYPYHEDLIKTYESVKDGEITMISRWGSTLKIRSAKSRSTITGSELELALVAEPGWVSDNIYNHMRARILSRLGRIIAIGTPQDVGGLLDRLVRATGRDESGRMVRTNSDDRLIANGAPWNESMLVYDMNPLDNPEYVKSERKAARRELTDAEFATEFEGNVKVRDGMKFPYLADDLLAPVPATYFREAKYILGIDQGPTNFAAALVAWDGNLLVPCYEYFNDEPVTMKRKLEDLRNHMQRWLLLLGGAPNAWVLTATDRDPPLWQIFLEMKDVDHKPWPTETVERYQNRRALGDNWRRENQEFFNNMCRLGKVRFHSSDIYEELGSHCYSGATLLFDDLRGALDKAESPFKESGLVDRDKGWIIKNAWRGDHVADAFYLALWTVYNGQVKVDKADQTIIHSPYEEAQRGLEYIIRASDAADEDAHGMVNGSDKIFRDVFGRDRGRPTLGLGHNVGHYSDY
jgi:hypothetical protein